MADASVSDQDRAALQALDARINAILPPQYQNCYDTVRPTSMGSAGLKFGPDGKVVWDEIWTSFCDLALAGGPAHRGTLLEAVPPEVAAAEPERYQEVVDEIARALWLVTGLPIMPGIAPGWVGVVCDSEEMAAWLVRAIVVENVMARHERSTLYLPAGPHFQLAKEIKNVVTSLAKTAHYWCFHMSPEQRTSAALGGVPLLEPALPEQVRAEPAAYQTVVDELVRGVRQATGLAAEPSPQIGWVCVPCDHEDMAVWLMRAIIVENILVRREGDVLYLPAHPRFGSDQVRKATAAVAEAWRLWKASRER